MASETLRTCWSCEGVAHMQLQGSLHPIGPYDPESNAEQVAGLFLCAACRIPSLGMFYVRGSGGSGVEWAERVITGQQAARHVKVVSVWHPSKGRGKSYGDEVPAVVAAVASEAHKCHSFGAYRAAVALSRAAVEAAAKAKGFEQRSFYDQIEAMTKSGQVLAVVTQGADIIREAGNMAVHDVLTVSHTEEDSATFLMIMDSVIDGLYSAPERFRQAAERNAELKQLKKGTSS